MGIVPSAQAVEYAAHNYSLFLLGVMILWFGWYGFQPWERPGHPSGRLPHFPSRFPLPSSLPSSAPCEGAALIPVRVCACACACVAPSHYLNHPQCEVAAIPRRTVMDSWTSLVML